MNPCSQFSLGFCQPLKFIFRGHSLGSKAEGREDREHVGGLGTDLVLVATVGLRKWAVLRVGLLSPANDTICSSLTSSMVSFTSSIHGLISRGFHSGEWTYYVLIRIPKFVCFLGE